MKCVFFVVCSHWNFCSIVSVIVQWPDKYSLKYLGVGGYSFFKFPHGGKAALVHGTSNNDWPLCQPLSDQKQYSAIKTHNPYFCRTRSSLPTLTPASHTRNVGCHPHDCLPRGWWLKNANHYIKCENLPKFTSLFIKLSSGNYKCSTGFQSSKMIASDNSI